MAIDWQTLDDQTPIMVPARPAAGIWTLVRSYVSGPRIIRIEADGLWRPVASLAACGADGLRHWAYGRERLLTRRAPLGALIGKIGGSNIATDDEMFVVGSAAVLTLDKAAGPLFLTVNDAPDGFDDNTGELSVTIA